MPQCLACLVTVTNLAARASVTVPHSCCDHRGACIPDSIRPLCLTPIGVTARTATSVIFFNYGDVAVSATFLVACNHSIQGEFAAGAGVWAGGRPCGTTIWGSLNAVTYGNSDVETTLLDAAGQGTLLLPAGLFVAGRTLRYECRGTLTCGNSQASRFKIKVDGANLIDNLGTLPNNLTAAYIEAQFDIFCRDDGAHGHIDSSGRTLIQTATGITSVAMRALIGADMEVNTLTAMAFDHTLQWSTKDPGNTLTIQRAHLRVLS